MSEHILYICRYYPPEISGGARRSSALVNELKSLGYKVTVAGPDGIHADDKITAHHPVYPAKQENYQKNKVGMVQGFLHFMRINLLLPDPEIRWALRLGKAITESGIRPDYIICSGPPESLYLIGVMVKNKCGGKLIADMRDPWIAPPQRQILLQNPLRRWLETKIAKHNFKQYDGIIAVSETVLDDGLSFAPTNIKTKIIGHFATDYIGAPYIFPNDYFNLVHTGSISLSNPLSEFEEFFTEFENVAVKRKDLRLWLSGQLNDDEINLIKSSNVADQVNILGAVSMDVARAMQKGADALLIVSGANSHALPGKFSEYSYCNKPIILSRKGKWCNLLPDAKYYSLGELLHLEKGSSETYPVQDVKQAAKNLVELFNLV